MAIKQQIIKRILRKAKTPDLLTALVNRLNNDDLQSLLMEVFSKRARQVGPATLRRQFAENRFLIPARVDPRLQLNFDQLAFQLLEADVQPVELSPVAPLGICSALATVDQNKILATIRNSEVCADSTNVMALICAQKREAALTRNSRDPRPVHLACSQRLLRTQFVDLPGFFGHFRIFTLCSAGRDTGSWSFEIAAIRKQISFYLRLLQTIDQIDLQLENVEVLLTVIDENRREAVQASLLNPLQAQFPAYTIRVDDKRESGRGYYQDLCFQINGNAPDGQYLQLVDGGFTDWTQKLLSNRKERLLISGLGSERLCLLCYQPGKTAVGTAEGINP